MSQLASPFPVHVSSSGEDHRILLHNVTWATYVMLRDRITSGGVRMTYLKGALEIMTTSRQHEVSKTMVARLLELFCLERDIPLFGYGNMTFQKEELERGLEPDECYCRDKDGLVPDVALEVIVSHGLLDKLEVYRGFGFREVWLFEAGAFKVLTLRGETYEEIPASEVLPEVDLVRIAHYAQHPDQHAALRTFRDELRAR